MPICSICKKDEDNPTDLGEFMKRSNICVHYFCLLLSTNLPQKGKDFSGILGFLLRDIRNEIKKSEERFCCYCNQPHATIACFNCKRYFHNVCGNKNDCVSEFSNEFRSYCHRHIPFRNEQKVADQKLVKQKMVKLNLSTCWICHDPLGKYSPTQTLRSYCCNNGYVHRYCLRKYAMAAGYHLVCLWCASKTFRDDVRKHGVFVPDREATWDNNETLRYTDLHRGYSQCDAKSCICPQGREFFRGQWKLIVCCMCGGSGVHEKCGRNQIVKNNYTCETCSEILSESKILNAQRKNANTNELNYTMFMSKTIEEAEDLLQAKEAHSSKELAKEAHSSKELAKEAHSSKEVSPTINTSIQSKEPQSQQNNSIMISSGREQNSKKELFMFRNNNEIVGTVQVEQNKLHKKSDNTVVCKEEDALDFSCTDKLLNSIFSDIVSEHRELSEDMVDEVFERYKLLLENWG